MKSILMAFILVSAGAASVAGFSFGVPDDRLGERVVLAIHPHPGEAIDPAAVLAFGKTKLADFKIPSEVKVTAAPFERNVLGKVNKIALRTQIFG